MKDISEKNKKFKLITLAFLLVLTLGFTNTKVLAQLQLEDMPAVPDVTNPDNLTNPFTPEGGENQDPVADRQDKDKEAMDKEKEGLVKLQKKDQELCENEAKRDGELESQRRANDYNDYNPNGDRDNDGVPNSRDNDNNNDGKPDTTPSGPPPPACAEGNGNSAGYIVANEGFSPNAYVDANGRSIGYGHYITGEENPPITGPIDENRARELYNDDYATAQECARTSAANHGVDYDTLSPERQTVITDMSYNMGCQGNGGINGFDNMWTNMRTAQQTTGQASQDAWNEAGNEITRSNYADQTGRRAENNADIMRTSDGSVIDNQISSAPAARNFCDETTVAWQKPFSILGMLFGPKVAQAIGDYVPVVEQDGDLMRHADKIETQTEKARTLLIQICTHLKAIRRIQQRFEVKMVEDAKIMRTKSTEIEKYRQAVFGENGITKTGYVTLDENGNETKMTDTENGQPLFVTNNQTYLENASIEAGKVAIDNLTQNNNMYNDAVLAGLQAEDSFSNSGPSAEDIQNVLGTSEQGNLLVTKNQSLAQGIFDNIPIVSTLLKPVRNTFAWLTGNKAYAAPANAKVNTGVDSDQFWTSFKNVVQKNPNVAYLRTRGDIEQNQNAAVVAAQETAAQGQGFLPVRTCLAKTTDGKTCAVWGTQQPGIIVKETDTAAVNSRLRQYENADEPGEIASGNEPNITETILNKPAPGGGGATGPGMTAPDGVADTSGLISDPNTNPTIPNDGSNNNPTGNGGGPAGNTDWSSLANLLGGFFNDSDNEGRDPESDQIIAGLQVLLQIASNISNAKPWIDFKAKDKGGDTSLIHWYSPNAANCKTNNKWVNGNGATVKESGVDINKSGSVRVVIKSGQSATYNIKCTNKNGDSTMSLPVSRK